MLGRKLLFELHRAIVGLGFRTYGGGPGGKGGGGGGEIALFRLGSWLAYEDTLWHMWGLATHGCGVASWSAELSFGFGPRVQYLLLHKVLSWSILGLVCVHLPH